MVNKLDLNYGKTVKPNRRKTTDALWGMAFVAPLTIGLLLFLAFPLVFAIVLAFCDYTLAGGIEPGSFGFQNFTRLFLAEEGLSWIESTAGEFWTSIGRAFFMCIGLLISMALSFVVANLLCGKIKLTNFFKSVYFVPTICSSVATTYMWQRMYEKNYGTINLILNKLGINQWLMNSGVITENIDWVGENMILGSIMFMTILFGFGTSMLLYYSAIKGVPRSYYEAAEMDGANAVQKFFFITVPSVSSITFYVLVTGVIGCLQGFAVYQVMANGDAGKEKLVMMPVLMIFNKMTGDPSLASAMGVILGLIIAIVTGINFVISNKWVHYET